MPLSDFRKEVIRLGVACALIALGGAQTSHALPDCPEDDLYEPNDEIAQATSVGPTVLLDDLVTCSGNPDFFSIPVSAGESVTIRVAFLHAEGDIDAYLFDAALGLEDPIVYGETVTDDETLTYTAPSTTDLILEVYGFSGASNLYGITVSRGLETFITYQGRLADNGAPANGNYSFWFMLYDVPEGGTPFAAQILYDVPVQDGLFSVRLEFAESLASRDGFYVETAVLEPGGPVTVLSPRVRHEGPVVANRLLPGSVIHGNGGAALMIDSPANGTGLQLAPARPLDTGRYTGIRIDSAYEGIHIEGGSLSPDDTVGVRVTQQNSGFFATGFWSQDNNFGYVSVNDFYGAYIDQSAIGGIIGVYVNSPTGTAAQFDGDVTINGTCAGCRDAARALNASGEALAPGQVVTIAGIEAVPGQAVPALKIRAAEPGDPVLGVIESVLVLEDIALPGKPGTSASVARRADGLVAPGAQALVITSGLVEVMLSGTKAAGQLGGEVVVDKAGVARAAPATQAANVVGLLAQEPAERDDGMAWVLLRQR